jgi:hypothetical protein
VENSPRVFATNLHSRALFIDCKRGSSVKIGRGAHCGKRVKTVWTRGDYFGYFSLAPGVSFRQNPAAQLNLSRLRISILRDAAQEGCARAVSSLIAQTI